MTLPPTENEVMDVVAAIEAGTLVVASITTPWVHDFLGMVEALVSNGWAFYLAREEDGAWCIDSLQTGDGAELSDETIRGEADPPPMPLIAHYRLTTPAQHARWGFVLPTAPGGTA